MRPDSTPDARYFARAMRNEMTVSERRAWNALKGRRLGVRFRRQVPMGPYVADFACLERRLVIEIDGPSHDWIDETHRTRYFESLGFHILRFTNETVAGTSIAESIQTWLEENEAI